VKKHERRPGERAGLGRDAVLAAAQALSAEAGIDGLSMRRVADRLGVAPNALYSYFADKAALLDALLDWLLVGIELPPADQDWRGGLAALMAATRRHLLAHPHLITLYLSRPGRGPNAIHLGEVMLSLLARAGVTGPPAVEALRILLIYTFGFAAHEAPRRGDPDPAARTAGSEAAFRGASGDPRMQALAGPLAQHADDVTFATGLRWLLAGIAGR
jgi:TetR/AcrR family transcriptional regulator, tetracycline repressor protein